MISNSVRDRCGYPGEEGAYLSPRRQTSRLFRLVPFTAESLMTVMGRDKIEITGRALGRKRESAITVRFKREREREGGRESGRYCPAMSF